MVRMNKKVLLILFIIILSALTLSIYYSDDPNVIDNSNKTTLTVSGLNCFSVEDMVESVNSHEYYKNHDNETLMWLMGLSGNVVFSSHDYYVVMSKSDAEKLPVEFATDVDINDTFECEIITNRSLGDDLPDVLYVSDVKFIKQDIKSFEV